MPADSSYRVGLTMMRPTPTVLHLPRQGEGAWYIALSRFQITAVPLRDIVWDGDAYKFRMDLRLGPGAAFTIDVTGVVNADGTIRGQLAPIGIAAMPFSPSFDGALRGSSTRPWPWRRAPWLSPQKA